MKWFIIVFIISIILIGVGVFLIIKLLSNDEPFPSFEKIEEDNQQFPPNRDQCKFDQGTLNPI